jgi:hypothetical protein
MTDHAVERVRDILAAAKQLAVEYYALTGKPLGVAGEVAEYVAVQTLGLELAIARTPSERPPAAPCVFKSREGLTAREIMRQIAIS